MKKIFLVYILIISLLTSCSETKKNNTVSNSMGDNSETSKNISSVEDVTAEDCSIYDSVITSFDEHFSIVSDMMEVGELLYVLGETRAKSSYNYFSYDIKENKKSNKDINLPQDIRRIYFFDDKLCVTYKNEEENQNIQIIDVNNRKNYDFLINEKDVSDIFLCEDKLFYIPIGEDKLCTVNILTGERSEHILPESTNDFFYKYLTVDKSGYIYFFCSDVSGNKALFKFDSDMNEIFENRQLGDMSGDIMPALIIHDGNLMIYSMDSEMSYFNIVDSQTGETLNRYELKNVEQIFIGYQGYDILYSFENSLYGYNFESQTDELLYSDICGENEVIMGATSENELFMCEYTYESSQNIIVLYDENGNITDEIQCTNEADGLIRDFFVNDNGNIYYLEENYSPEFLSEDEEEIATHIIHTVSPDGSYSSFEIPVYNELRYALFMKVDTSGNVLMGEEKDGMIYLSSYDKFGKKNGELEITDSTSFKSAVYSEEMIVINYATKGETYAGIAVRQSSDKISIIHEYDSELCGDMMRGNDKYDIFISEGSTIYGFDIEEKQKTRLVDFMTNGISYLDVHGIYMYKDRLLLAVADDWEWLDIAGNQYDKTVINLSGIGMAYMSDVQEKIMKFNSTNDKYHIVCTDYSGDSESKEQFNLDILTGKVDIVLFSGSYGMSSYDYNKGIFVDLYPFIDNDSEINRDDFFVNVFDMYSENGKLYEIVPEFTVSSLMMSRKKSDDELTWTIDEFDNFLTQNTGIQMLDTSMDLFDYFISACIGDFIDEETNKCKFTDDDFKRVLLFLKEGINYVMWEGESVDELINGNKSMADFYIGNIMDPQNELYDNVYYRGFPSNTSNGIVFEPDISFSVLSNSENKEGAWEFIRTFLLDDYQKNIEQKLPIKVSAYDYVMPKRVHTTVMTDEMFSMYKKIVSGADCKYIQGSRLSKIIREEAELYFEGETSLDKAAKNIQNKVTLYLNES